ncbi:uncharacterized protein LOC123905222 [Trifolium pratense]|uniref:uncharacterized protein LOC123905222 n=1 Tax=Trifolium pratense TaxID=57577 RepID=UPI001E6915C0|nr:uncharacterized protein LOC123905222 [Trifolium pratense]
MTNNTDKDCMEKILAIIYEIWNARNLLVFQEKNLPPQEISSNAFKKLHEYQSHGEVKTQKSQTSPPSTNSCSNNISWSPPLRGTLKINVDAHLSSDGHWFAWMVLRRSDGSAVGAATRVHKGMTNVVMGEAMGLNDAIDWIEKMEKHQVVFEMDSQIIVNAVRNREEIRKNWGSVVRRCIRFLKDNPNSDLVWVNHKANRVAHEIAKWAEHEPNCDWNECVPMCVWPLIQKDKGFVSLA